MSDGRWVWTEERANQIREAERTFRASVSDGAWVCTPPPSRWQRFVSWLRRTIPGWGESA